jgi:hypothetical protein
MKKIVSLFIVFIFIQTKMMAQVINDLVIFSNDGDKFTLILNGEKRNANPETRVKVSSLNLVRYKVKIVFDNNKFEDLDDAITFNNNGYECVFGLEEKNKRKHTLVYVSSTLINPPLVNNDNSSLNNSNNTNTNTNNNTNSTSTNTTNYNSTSGSNTYSSSNTGNTSYSSGNTISLNNGLGVGVNNNGGVSLKTKEGNLNLGPHNETTAVINVLGNAINLHKAPEKVGCKSPMLPTQFDIAKKDITTPAEESEKVKAANQLMQNNCLVTAQVQEIMGLFSNDQTKFEFARDAYAHTSDLNNYHKLKDSFTSEAYKKDFHTYIESKK